MVKPLNNLYLLFPASFKEILINIFIVLAKTLSYIIYCFVFILAIIDEIILTYINELIVKVIANLKKPNYLPVQTFINGKCV